MKALPSKDAAFKSDLQHLQSYGSTGKWAEDVADDAGHGSESDMEEGHSHHNFIVPPSFFRCGGRGEEGVARVSLWRSARA